MSLGTEQEIFAKHMVQLIQRAWELGFSVRIGEVQRPIEMQELYVKRGSSKTMNSQHIKKLAVDLVLLKDGKICSAAQIKPLGDWWQSLDAKNQWGGSWRGLVEAGKSSFVDSPHFERKD